MTEAFDIEEWRLCMFGLQREKLQALGEELDLAKEATARLMWGPGVDLDDLRVRFAAEMGQIRRQQLLTAEGVDVMTRLHDCLQTIAEEAAGQWREESFIGTTKENIEAGLRMLREQFCGLLFGVETLMRKASKHVRPRFPDLAGLGPHDGYRIGAVHEPSVVEAVCKVAARVVHAVSQAVGMGVLPEAPSKPQKRRPQTGREVPEGAEGLEDDDRRILECVLTKVGSAKDIGKAMDGLSASHVRHRMSELRKWRLMERGRPYRLTKRGREWVEALRQQR